jgi:hypothetical protein
VKPLLVWERMVLAQSEHLLAERTMLRAVFRRREAIR